MIKRYKFNTELEADNLIATLSTTTNTGTEEELTINEFQVLQKVPKEIITEAAYDDTGAVLTEAILSDIQFVDILWNDAENEAFKPFELLMNGEMSSISGVYFETRKDRLNRKIKKGIIIPNGAQSYWFDKEALNDFITMKNNLILLNAPTIKWKATDKNWYEIPMTEALQISVQGQIAFQQIYENN